MKKIINIALLCSVVFIASSYHARAQQEGDLMLNLNYNLGVPTGSFKNSIVSKNSWKGYTGDIMYFFNNKLSGGLSLGYQGYYEKAPRATYTDGNSDISAVISNRVEIAPFLVKAQYYPLGGTTAVIQPYLSLGTGLSVVDYDYYEGLYGYSRSTGRFSAQGGLGFAIPFGKLTSSGLQLGANYNYVNYDQQFFDKAGNTFKVNNLGNFNFYVGVHFPLR